MSRIQLKERQFEPTGVSLGEFEPVDLESFDLTFTDSDEDDSQQSGKGSSDQSNKSKVPDPLDENPLKKDNKNDNSQSSGGGSSSGSSSQSQEDNSDNGDERDDNEPEGVQDIPDEWDPYGEDLDNQDPDLPEDKQDYDSEQQQGSGSSSSSGSGSSPGESDGSDVPSQVPNQSSDSDGSEDGGDVSAEGEAQSGSESSGGDNSRGDESESPGGDFDDMLDDYEDLEDSSDGDDKLDSAELSDSNSISSSQSSQSGGGRSSRGRGESTDDGSETGDADISNSQSGGSSSGASGNSGNANGPMSSNLDLKRSTPSAEELEQEDTDFDPADLGTLSDLEKALQDIDQKSADSVKERRNSENSRSEKEDRQSSMSQKDRDDEISAAKDIVGKAAKDTQADQAKSGEVDEDDDDYSRRYNRDMSESQEDILKDLGAGNLTTLFNPGNLQDWRSRLDRIFDKALGFDITTNPNLVNKKIEDAPPGREDEVPQIKNIAVLLDMSGSMGAREFKQVISHIDTMLRARKLTKVWFHIIGFGSSRIDELMPYYSKVKGSRFKQIMMTKYKNDAGWMTDILPGIVLCAHKVHKPDAVIIMTDAEFNGNLRQFESDSKAKMFMKKHKNKIIWALTKNARLQGVKDYDPTAIAKKRYIKFKKGGHEESWD